MAESRRPGFTVEWKFQYGFLKSTPNFYHWYDFFLADLHNSAWRIDFQLPTDYFRAHIQRLSEGDAGPVSLYIDCDFDLLLCQQNPNAPRSLRKGPPEKVQKMNFKRNEREEVPIVPRSVIDALKKEDELLLRVHIWSRESSFLHPVSHSVGSPWECPAYFMWKVKDFSLLRRGDRRNYALQKEKGPSDLTLALFLGDDDDTVCIQQTGNVKSYCWISSVSMLDARGGKTLCLQNCLLLHRKSWDFTIPLHFSKNELLEEKEKFLPNDQLTLLFDLRSNVGKGVLYKVVVGDPMVDDDIAAPDTHNILHTCARNDLYDLYKEGKLTDFELRIGSETVHAHKAILAARSPVLLDMLTNDLRESSQQGVVIEDLEVDTAKQLLDFMYLDSVPDLDWTSAMKLYSAASKYSVVGLKKKCSEILKSKLCVQNVCPILSVADTLSDDDLKQFVQEFISQNEGPIIHSHEWKNFSNENMALSLRVMLLLTKKRLEASDS